MAPSIEIIEPSIVPSKTAADNDVATEAAKLVKQNEVKEIEIADSLGGHDTYINSSKDTEWVPWVGDISIKPYRFENRTGSYSMSLKSDTHAELGKHRHRGEVRAFTVRGEWGYHEYDWVAKTGDCVTETPGSAHTLYIGPNTEIMFHVTGSLEFLNEDGSLREIYDAFSFWRVYAEHCEKVGKEPNKKLWY